MFHDVQALKSKVDPTVKCLTGSALAANGSGEDSIMQKEEQARQAEIRTALEPMMHFMIFHWRGNGIKTSFATQQDRAVAPRRGTMGPKGLDMCVIVCVKSSEWLLTSFGRTCSFAQT